MASNNFRKEAPRNLMMNLVNFILNIFLGLWLVPYLVSKIGSAAYGLVPLAMVFTEYMGVITIAINSSIARFMTLSIQNGDWISGNKVFNTAFFIILSLIVIQLPILGYVVYDIDDLIDIPAEILKDVYWLFALTYAGYLLSLFSTAFNSSMYALNRLDLSRLVDISKILTRTITIVVLFSIYEPSLIYVGIGNFLAAVSTITISFNFWKKLTPNLNIRISSFDISKLKEIFGMGGWMIVNYIGYLLFLKVDIIVINKILGANPAGDYAVILQWNSLVRNLAGVLAGIVGPMIIIAYSTNRIKDVFKYSELSVKLLSIFVGLITGLICGLADPLLMVWVGYEFTQYSPILVVMLSHLFINLGVLPLNNVNTALNKVRLPGIMSCLIGGLNFLLAIIFVKYLDFGLIGVAIAGSIALTLKNGLFTPIYAAHILKTNKFQFLKPLFLGGVTWMMSFAISYLSYYFVQVNTWLSLIVIAAISGLIITVLLWMFILGSNDRKEFLNLIPDKFKVLR